jgi:Tol biopolymer transport system component
VRFAVKRQFRIHGRTLNSSEDTLIDIFPEDILPSWSPDGEWIAFMKTSDVTPKYPCPDSSQACDGLYMIKPDARELTFITGNVFFFTQAIDLNWIPAWSPDSQWVSVISSARESILVNAQNGETFRFSDYSLLGKPSWAPDGRITFISDHNGNGEIYTLMPDGTGLMNLTNSPGREYGVPAWSWSGHFVAFYYWYDEKSYLCVMHADGSNRNCFEGFGVGWITWLPPILP